jgi:uncharacterized protein YqjF (DUF2071 family)
MAKTKPAKTLLACQWRDVVALNFEIDDRAVTPHIPPGTRIAKYNDHTMVTLMAKNTRELQPYGGSLTLFRSVLSIDLRCYAQYENNDGIQVGHVLLKHVVSNRMCALLLRFLYGQPCLVQQITHTATDFELARRDALPSADYRWTTDGHENHFSVKAREVGRKPADDSREQFVLQQKYRFAGTPRGTIAYEIRQTPWVVWRASSGSYDCEKSDFVDTDFGRYLRKPMSVHMSAGGEVKIYKPRPLSRV